MTFGTCLKMTLIRHFQTAATVFMHRLPHSAKPHSRILPQRGVGLKDKEQVIGQQRFVSLGLFVAVLLTVAAHTVPADGFLYNCLSSLYYPLMVAFAGFGIYERGSAALPQAQRADGLHDRGISRHGSCGSTAREGGRRAFSAKMFHLLLIWFVPVLAAGAAAFLWDLAKADAPDLSFAASQLRQEAESLFWGMGASMNDHPAVGVFWLLISGGSAAIILVCVQEAVHAFMQGMSAEGDKDRKEEDASLAACVLITAFGLAGCFAGVSAGRRGWILPFNLDVTAVGLLFAAFGYDVAAVLERQIFCRPQDRSKRKRSNCLLTAVWTAAVSICALVWAYSILRGNAVNYVVREYGGVFSGLYGVVTSLLGTAACMAALFLLCSVSARGKSPFSGASMPCTPAGQAHGPENAGDHHHERATACAGTASANLWAFFLWMHGMDASCKELWQFGPWQEQLVLRPLVLVLFGLLLSSAVRFLSSGKRKAGEVPAGGNAALLQDKNHDRIMCILFYAGFAMAYFRVFLDSTLLNVILEDWTVPYTICTAGVCLLLVAAADALSNMEQNRFIMIIAVLFLLVSYLTWSFGELNGRGVELMLTGLVIPAGRRKNPRPLLWFGILIGAGVMLTAYHLSMTGVLPYVVRAGYKHAFGMQYHTDAASHIFYMAAAYTILKDGRPSVLGYILLSLCLYIVHHLMACATDTIALLLLTAGCLVCTAAGAARILLRRTEKKSAEETGHPAEESGNYDGAGRQKKRNLSSNTHFTYRGMRILLLSAVQYVFLLCAAASILESILFQQTFYDRTVAEFPQLKTFMDRISLGHQALTEYPLRLLGNLIEEYGSGGTGYEVQTHSYFFIDNSYLRMLLMYGLLFFVMYLLITVLLQRRFLRGKNFWAVYVMIIIAITGILDHHIMDICYNVVPVLLMMQDVRSAGRQKERV